MSTKTDVTLPPLPICDAVMRHGDEAWYRYQMRAYARAAIFADRQQCGGDKSLERALAGAIEQARFWKGLVMAIHAHNEQRGGDLDERAMFDQWFCQHSELPLNADTTQYDEAFLAYAAWQARAALASQKSGEQPSKMADIRGLLRPDQFHPNSDEAQKPVEGDADRGDELLALDLLDRLFSAWENGPSCYEDPDSQGGFLGNAFRLDDETFRACVALLERRRPRIDAIAQQGKEG